MSTLSPSQQACLDAMGIDVWVTRDSLIEEETDNSPELHADVKTSISTKENSDVTHDIKNNVAPAVNATVKNTASPQSENSVTSNTAQLKPVAQNSPLTMDVPQDWNGLRQAVSTCQRCDLHTSRTQTVFGEGNENADWLIIGDTPTQDDDTAGKPFTGPSGDLLTAMLRAIGLTRQQVYVANTLKCTTPNNREPEAIESETCLEYLKQQIRLIKPKLILVVGQSAAQRLLNTHSTLARLRQKAHTLEGSNIHVVVTYHPASLLSMPANKGKAWQDLLYAKKLISTEAVL